MAGIYGLLKKSLATVAKPGAVKKAAAHANFAGADVASLRAELNTFKGKLEAAGIVDK